jgi:hypothetical protein
MRHIPLPSVDPALRKLAALEALSRYTKPTPPLVGSISIEPNLWPTSALLDWWSVLHRVTGMPQRAARPREVEHIVREVEPGRTECFLHGTEPPASLQRLAEGFPRILTPVSGTVIALDPDTPPARPRLIFEGDAGNRSLRWVLDGRDLGSAARPLLWEPSPGQHTISLVDQDRRVLDTVSFIVRDGALPSSE